MNSGQEAEPVGRRPAPDEAEQLRQAQAGEMRAWSALYQAHFPEVYRHVRFLSGDPDQADDLVQETFARALVKLRDFDGRSSLSTWLHGVALNVVRNHWRAQRNTKTAHDRLRSMNQAAHAGATPTNEQFHLRKRKAEAVYAILETLPEHLREAFVLRDLKGHSPAEAATQLGITPGNLSVRAARARERVRKELESLGWIAPRGDRR